MQNLTIIHTATQIQDHLVSCNDVSLDFYGLSTKARDLLGRTTITAAYNPAVPFAGLLHAPKRQNDKNSVMHLEYGDAYTQAPPLIQKKAISHEFAHFFQQANGGPDFKANIATILPIAQSTLVLRFLGGIASVAAGGITAIASNYDPATILLTPALTYAIIGTGFGYANRCNETGADLFADKVVPEITLREAFTAVLGEAAPKILAGTKGSWLDILRNFDGDHPYMETRMKQSEKDCPRFLAYKQQNNIPSLITG